MPAVDANELDSEDASTLNLRGRLRHTASHASHASIATGNSFVAHTTAGDAAQGFRSSLMKGRSFSAASLRLKQAQNTSTPRRATFLNVPVLASRSTGSPGLSAQLALQESKTFGSKKPFIQSCMHTPTPTGDCRKTSRHVVVAFGGPKDADTHKVQNREYLGSNNFLTSLQNSGQAKAEAASVAMHWESESGALTLLNALPSSVSGAETPTHLARAADAATASEVPISPASPQDAGVCSLCT